MPSVLRALIAALVGFTGATLVMGALQAPTPSREDTPLASSLRDAAAREASRRAPEPLPPGPVLRPFTFGPEVSALRRRLDAEPGLLDLPTGASRVLLSDGAYGPLLYNAVRALQHHHGLTPDGLVGPRTRALLDLSPTDRADRLRAAHQRLLQLPGDGLGPEILVELSRQVATVWNDGALVSTHRVLIGRDNEDNATPEVSGTIDRVVFHPRWIVPRRIANEELVDDDPAELNVRGFQVVQAGRREAVTRAGLDRVRTGKAWLEQDPGRGNPLGQVKLLFDNPHHVALHGTPAEHLFAHTRRTHTHGCVRVDNALMLGMWVVLQQPGWDLGRLSKVLVGGEETEITLIEPVAVHLVDLPAGLSPDGLPVFPPDVYGRWSDAQP